MAESCKAAGQGALGEELLLGEGETSAFSKEGGSGPRCEKLWGAGAQEGPPSPLWRVNIMTSSTSEDSGVAVVPRRVESM